jgi:hypothetical protein
VVSLDWLLDSISNAKLAPTSSYLFTPANGVPKSGLVVPTVVAPAAATAGKVDNPNKSTKKRSSLSTSDDKDSQQKAADGPPKKKKDVEQKNPPNFKVEVDELCTAQGIYASSLPLNMERLPTA